MPPQAPQRLALEWTAPGPFPAGAANTAVSPVYHAAAVVQSPHIRTEVFLETEEGDLEVRGKDGSRARYV